MTIGGVGQPSSPPPRGPQILAEADSDMMEEIFGGSPEQKMPLAGKGGSGNWSTGATTLQLEGL